MGSFRIAKTGFNALTDPVQDMMVDSTSQTLGVAQSGSGSVSITSGSGYYQFRIPNQLPFFPVTYFFTTHPATGYSISGAYQLAAYSYGILNQGYSINTPGMLLEYNQYNYSQASSYTANYMYYNLFLAGVGSLYGNNPVTDATYLNVAGSGVNAITANIQNLSYTSQEKGALIVSNQQYNASGTGNGSVIQLDFGHGLGTAHPFIPMIEDVQNGGLIYTFNNQHHLSFSCSVDSSQWHFQFQSTNGVAYNFSFRVFYLPVV